MEQYNTLWTKDQKIIFDLGNLVNDVYTGPFDTRLTVTFFTVPDSHATADTILPISAEQSGANMGSAFTVPLQNASVSYTLPPNIERAVISLSACGQIGEEFWFTNVFSSDTTTFASNPTLGTLNGYGPFREVQLLIDGQLAGVSWPFPVVFTGGIVPGLWRPIVGIDAFDLRQHEIDVTPWLSLLCNGVAHTFEIRVAGLDDDGAGHATISETVGSYWVVTGTIFLFLGASDIVSTGSTPTIDLPAPEIEISSIVTTNASGANETLTYNTTVSRDIFISSTIKTVKGSRLATWTQQLSYSNFNSLTSGGLIQATSQNTTGTDTSTSGYAKFYSYPIAVNSSFSENPAGNIGINATLSHGLTFNIFGPSIFPSGIQSFNSTSLSDVSPIGQQGLHTLQLPTRLPSFSGALLSTTQSGSASFLAAGNASYSFGTTTQDFDFKGGELSKPEATYELYHRHVVAVNSTITEDEQRLAGRTVGRPAVRPAEALVQNAIEGFSVKALLGRGPGGTKLMG
ncbi:hypothetical protein MMC21_006720 [Puttea exsequens]|nr:hypothetical protein [Puttea exsequens]